jgi:hypothetical protein
MVYFDHPIGGEFSSEVALGMIKVCTNNCDHPVHFQQSTIIMMAFRVLDM